MEDLVCQARKELSEDGHPPLERTAETSLVGWVKGFEMPEQRRRWSPEFKRDAVNLVRSSGQPVAEIAR
jgi:hypothetical protein